MSRFFTVLGEHFLQKHAGRVPWPTVLQALRREHLLPEFMPHIPFIEPDVLPPLALSAATDAVGPAVPDEFVAPKNPEEKEEGKEAVPEPRPKSKSEDDQTP